MLRSTGILTNALLRELEREFRLDWLGIHGVKHWGRVRANGLRLAALTGANPRVVELFAVLHDSCRWNDDHDPDHGLRGADSALRLQGRFFELDDEELELLRDACVLHSDGHLRADVTLQTCWDADRLDLGRVGITPVAERLCTEAARDPAMLGWAWRRSLYG